MNRIITGVVSAIAFMLILGIRPDAAFLTAMAQEAQEAQETQKDEQQLLIPEDLTVKTNQDYELQELRIGGRLERVTVKWNNGVTEVYQNKRNDTVWSAEENELGDVQNVRQWRLGSW